MPVRNTENHFPPSLPPGYFGESFADPSRNYCLVSYLTSPISADASNTYVVFAVDPSPADSYRWSVLNNSATGQAITEHGLMKLSMMAAGNLIVVVEVLVDGAVRATLTLRQKVIPSIRDSASGNPWINANWLEGVTHEALASVGEPATTREAVEDLRTYIFRASLLSGAHGIPPAFVASICYRETIRRPKERELHRFWYPILTTVRNRWIALGDEPSETAPLQSLIREDEIEIHADELSRGISDGRRSLGPCQIQPCTAAMTLGLTPWRQEEQGEDPAAVEADRVAAYDALSLERKVDIFNHLRFPKASVLLCARHLAKVRRRANRWPSQLQSEFAANSLGISITATEHNRGPTTSVLGPEEESGSAKPNDYGESVLAIYNHPVIREAFVHLPASAFVLEGSVGLGGNNDPDDIWRLKARLIGLGFDWLDIDQNIDDETIAAIMLFQSVTLGADVVGGDGRVDVPGRTYSWLRSSGAPVWQSFPDGAAHLGFLRDTDPDQNPYLYCTSWLVDLIQSAGVSYQESFRELQTRPTAPLVVHELSARMGGTLYPHAGHQTGLCADLRLPKNDGNAGGITYLDPLYDRDTARAQLRALREQSNWQLVGFNDPTLIAEHLCQALPGHDNHFHLETRVPAGLP